MLRHCQQGHSNIHWMLHRNGIPFNFPNAKAATFCCHGRLHDCPILDHRPLFFLRLMRINLGGIQWLLNHRVSPSCQVCDILPRLQIPCTMLFCRLISDIWSHFELSMVLIRARTSSSAHAMSTPFRTDKARK